MENTSLARQLADEKLEREGYTIKAGSGIAYLYEDDGDCRKCLEKKVWNGAEWVSVPCETYEG